MVNDNYKLSSLVVILGAALCAKAYFDIQIALSVNFLIETTDVALQMELSVSV